LIEIYGHTPSRKDANHITGQALKCPRDDKAFPGEPGELRSAKWTEHTRWRFSSEHGKWEFVVFFPSLSLKISWSGYSCPKVVINFLLKAEITGFNPLPLSVLAYLLYTSKHGTDTSMFKLHQ